MSNLSVIFAPKPIKKPFVLANDINSPKISRPVKQCSSTKYSKCDLRSSQFTYLSTSNTLRESESNFSNFESDLTQEVVRSELCSILSQQDDKLPFALCEEYTRREMHDVERVSNPFFKNFDLENEDQQPSEEMDGDIFDNSLNGEGNADNVHKEAVYTMKREDQEV